MRVQQVIVDSKTRYLLVDDDHHPVVVVVRYLKYLDNIGKAENTLKSYCFHMKLYFQFLHEKEVGYQEADLNLLSEFIGWLRHPHQSAKVVPFEKTSAKRSERTVNTILTCVVGFYEYLTRSDTYNKPLKENLTRQISGRFRTFKPFLHHISKGKMVNKNVITLKEPRRKIRILSREQIQSIHDACSNIRDELLIRVLYEGGLRIGEALSLWIEDFDISSTSIRVRKSKTAIGEGRKVYVTAETMNVFQQYLIDIHDADINFVFINLSGPNKGQPLQDWSIRDLVKRIRKKTSIDFTPHMLRHTYATEMHANGADAAIIQKLLGHAQVQTTIQTYLHPSDETIRREWEMVHTRQKEEIKE